METINTTPCTLVFHLIQGQGTEPHILREREASKTGIQTCNLSVLRPFSRSAVTSVKLNKGNWKRRSIKGPIQWSGGGRGEERESERSFWLDFWSSLIKTVWKLCRTPPWVLPFCAQQSVSVMSWTRLTCEATVANTSQAHFSCSSLAKN